MSSNHRRSSNSIEKEVSSRTSIILFSEGQELRFRVMACALYTPQLNQITFGGLPSTHQNWIKWNVVCMFSLRQKGAKSHWIYHDWMKQGRIHGRTVADGWAGAEMQKSTRKSKMLPTDGRTDQHGNVCATKKKIILPHKIFLTSPIWFLLLKPFRNGEQKNRISHFQKYQNKIGKIFERI